MGVFGDIKDSIQGSDSGGGSKRSNSSDFSSGSDDFGSDFGNEDFGNSFDNNPSNQGNQPSGGVNNPQRQNTGGQKPQSNRGSRSGQQRRQPQNNSPNPSEKALDSNNSGGRTTPNPQTGRPQKGEASPQLSSETEKKLENAGLSDQNTGNSMGQNNNGRQRMNQESRQDRGQNRNQLDADSRQMSQGGTVADNKDDLEEIKSQNEQIIELLKRINRSIGNGNQSRHGGRM